MSKIQKFFEGQTLFITGGTGFIGKILVEKLLRTSSKIEKIYLLIRPKKGKNIVERFDGYFNLALFDPLKEKDPSAMKKVIPISGDVAKPGLGLSEVDRQMLINEVSIVIHAAATTKFDDPLSVAVPINVYSVLEIIKLCRELRKLKVAVHVSTAFIQSDLNRIEEKVYPLPMTYEEVNNTIDIIKRRNLSKTAEKQFTKILLGNFPNTYVFTKNMAEGILNEEASDLPFCIYRFPIALATYKEPVTGWVDVAQGINQGLIWLGKGLVRILLIPDYKDVFHFVPADFICNALIAATWNTGTNMNRRSDDNNLPVYNYVNGDKNPLTKGLFVNTAQSLGPQYVPSSAIYWPDVFFTKTKTTYEIMNVFVHLLPALIIDFILKIFGKNPKFHRFYKKGRRLLKSGQFFMEKSWSIDNKNIEALWERLSPDDKTLFPFDMTNLDWVEVNIELWKGVIKYILKEDISPESQKKSLRRYYKLLVIHRTIQILFVTFMFWLLWKIFYGFFS